MSLLSIPIFIFIGGAVNTLLSENGFTLPKKFPVNGANEVGI